MKRFYLGEDRSDLIPRLPEYRGHQGDRLYGGEHPEGLREGDYKWGIEVNPAGDVRLTINEMISDPETARRIAFEAIFGTTDKDGNLANGLMDHFLIHGKQCITISFRL